MIRNCYKKFNAISLTVKNFHTSEFRIINSNAPSWIKSIAALFLDFIEQNILEYKLSELCLGSIKKKSYPNSGAIISKALK